jgi:hypothetical protein
VIEASRIQEAEPSRINRTYRSCGVDLGGRAGLEEAVAADGARHPHRGRTGSDTTVIPLAAEDRRRRERTESTGTEGRRGEEDLFLVAVY